MILTITDYQDSCVKYCLPNRSGGSVHSLVMFCRVLLSSDHRCQISILHRISVRQNLWLLLYQLQMKSLFVTAASPQRVVVVVVVESDLSCCCCWRVGKNKVSDFTVSSWCKHRGIRRSGFQGEKLNNIQIGFSRRVSFSINKIRDRSNQSFLIEYIFNIYFRLLTIS